MAEIQPFRAYRYDTKQVALKDVLTQPYDKISAEMQKKYYGASPYNLIPVEKGFSNADDTPQNNVYTRAAKKLDEWIAQNVLVKDSVPAIYVYSQDFLVPGTQTRRVRMGFIALGRVEDYDAHVVFRHERTLSGPKADRIELMRNTRSQTGQLFLLYDDSQNTIDTLLEKATKAVAPSEMVDEYGVTHRLWPVSDPAAIAQVQKLMSDKKIVIADGHHRYETALTLRNEARHKSGSSDPMGAWEFAMMTFVNTHSKGLIILPTHRVISGIANFSFEKFRDSLAAYFDWYSYPFGNESEKASAYEEFRKSLDAMGRERRAIGAYAGGGAFYLFVLKANADLATAIKDVSDGQRSLDVVLLHRLILEKGLGITAEAVAGEKGVSYEREMDAAIAAVDRGAAQMTFLLNPVNVHKVTSIALGGDVMPQKSTDFYPKLMSGIAIYRAEGSVGK